MSDETWQPPTLETDRLILRAITEVDAPAIFEYVKNPQVSLFTMWEPHESIEDTLHFIRTFVKKRYLQREPEFGICLKENPSQVIGTIGCFWHSREHCTMEMGYALSEDHWGQGVIPEAARTVMNFVFANYKVERLQAHFKVGNEASGRVMKKLGMTKEGLLRSAVFHRKQFWDVIFYSILRRELRH